MNSIGNGFGTITDYAYTDKCDEFGGSVDDFTNAIDNFISNSVRILKTLSENNIIKNMNIVQSQADL